MHDTTSNTPPRTGSRSKEIGRRGEDATCQYLRHMGVEILERNWRCLAGEADIVALDDGELVFVEVKARTDERCGLPEEAITPEKRARYEQIAMDYLRQSDLSNMPVRFDVSCLVLIGEDKALLRYHRDAFCRDF